MHLTICWNILKFNLRSKYVIRNLEKSQLGVVFSSLCLIFVGVLRKRYTYSDQMLCCASIACTAFARFSGAWLIKFVYRGFASVTVRKKL